MAMNSSPARIARESIDTPANRARGLSPVPGRVPRASSTCAIDHRISSSRDSSYSSTNRPVEELMRWTIAQVADALGTRPGTGLNPLARLAGVSIDSRAIRAGELFIAIHGPRHDGHDHVASALEGAAIAAGGAEARAPPHSGARRGPRSSACDTPRA